MRGKAKLILFFILIFWLRWVFVAGSGRSPVAASRGYSLVGVCRLASHCGDSCCGTWAQGARGSVVAACSLSNCGFSCSHGMWNLPRAGIKPVSPALGADSYPLYHQGSPKEIFLHLVWERKKKKNSLPKYLRTVLLGNLGGNTVKKIYAPMSEVCWTEDWTPWWWSVQRP